ncbi:hypothetical protein HPP92_014883 [Vanilla planifolia]|uniref:Uncharacterized protein n=1 Tax=Vanilla planifolia TaxID=51239 RepID=A0A835QWQ7_VANPL|nr:hypothetical protein HPP92_014883 [Vanilla planifolia]
MGPRDSRLSSEKMPGESYDIFQLFPQQIQVAVLSATMPTEALEMTGQFMNKLVRILVKRDELTLEGIEKEDRKLESLYDIHENLPSPGVSSS